MGSDGSWNASPVVQHAIHVAAVLKGHGEVNGTIERVGTVLR